MTVRLLRRTRNVPKPVLITPSGAVQCTSILNGKPLTVRFGHVNMRPDFDCNNSQLSKPSDTLERIIPHDIAQPIAAKMSNTNGR